MIPSIEASIRIGSLPGPQLLQTLAGQGYRKLINLSGVDLVEIYGHQALACFQSEIFIFPDVFSAGKPLIIGEEPTLSNDKRYVALTSEQERQQFLSAILATDKALRNGGLVFVFCDRGIGRSPLVTLAALLRCSNMTLSEGLYSVSKLQPQAVFTDISLSALCWSQHTLGQQ